MLQAAAAVAGGFWVHDKCSNFQLPRLRRAIDEAETFRLSVSVLAASIPSLETPGVLRRQRPCLEVSLGEAKKTTELAKFEPGSSSRSNPLGVECPWRFDDTLVFVASPADLTGPGIRFALQAHSDVRLGLVDLQLSGSQELGEVTVDLRNRVLPGCILAKSRDPDGSGSKYVWETPVLVLPLHRVLNGPSEVVAHVTLSFSVTAEPEALMKAADASGQSLTQKMAQQFVHQPLKWVTTAAQAECSSQAACDIVRTSHRACGSGDSPPMAHNSALDSSDSFVAPLPGPPSTLRALEAAQARKACRQSGESVPLAPPFPVEGPGGAAAAPDNDSGWVCTQNASGRTFWHHLSLGPPPWEPPTQQRQAMPATATPQQRQGGILRNSSPNSAQQRQVMPGTPTTMTRQMLGNSPPAHQSGALIGSPPAAPQQNLMHGDGSALLYDAAMQSPPMPPRTPTMPSRSLPSTPWSQEVPLEHGNLFRYDSHRCDQPPWVPGPPSAVNGNMMAAQENPLVPRSQTAVVYNGGGYATESNAMPYNPQAGSFQEAGTLPRAQTLSWPKANNPWAGPQNSPTIGSRPVPNFGSGVHTQPPIAPQNTSTTGSGVNADGAKNRRPQRTEQYQKQGGVLGLELQKGWSPGKGQDCSPRHMVPSFGGGPEEPTFGAATEVPRFGAGPPHENPVGDMRQLHEQFRIRPDTWSERYY